MSWGIALFAVRLPPYNRRDPKIPFIIYCLVLENLPFSKVSCKLPHLFYFWNQVDENYFEQTCCFSGKGGQVGHLSPVTPVTLRFDPPFFFVLHGGRHLWRFGPGLTLLRAQQTPGVQVRSSKAHALWRHLPKRVAGEVPHLCSLDVRQRASEY